MEWIKPLFNTDSFYNEFIQDRFEPSRFSLTNRQQTSEEYKTFLKWTCCYRYVYGETRQGWILPFNGISSGQTILIILFQEGNFNTNKKTRGWPLKISKYIWIQDFCEIQEFFESWGITGLFKICGILEFYEFGENQFENSMSFQNNQKEHERSLINP